MSKWGWGVVAVAALAGCQPKNTFSGSGIDITQFFPFDGDAVQHWEFINRDSAVSYKLVADQSPVIEESPDGQIYAVDWTIECVSADPYCVPGLTKTVKWRVTESRGVFLHGVSDGLGNTTNFTPPIQLAEAEMNTDDTVQTVTNGATFTATYLGYETCPVRWAVDWGDDCIHINLDDGDGNPDTNGLVTGDYWAIIGFNVVAVQSQSDSDVWELSTFDCVGDDC
jgi:hypothetical protein